MKGKRDRLGIGMALDHNPVDCAREAAKMALNVMGSPASWALVFSGGRHDPEGVLKGLRSALGEVPIVGGSAVGVITNSSLDYTGYECAVAAFSSRLPKPVVVAASDLDHGEIETGRQLGLRLSETVQGEENVLLFYDSVRSGGPPPSLNTASLLLDGIYDGLAGKTLKITGAGLVGDFQLSKSYLFDGHKRARQGVVAVVLPEALSIRQTIMHGCIPVSSFLEITRIDGPVVYEINHRPALEILLEAMGKEPKDMGPDTLSLTVTLGEKHGDPYAPYHEEAYVNRLIVAANPQDGSVVLFESDFQVGTRVQIMTRNNELMLNSVKDRAHALAKAINSDETLCAFYIDCAGRASAFGGSEIEEASLVQEALGGKIPLMGFFSGVEIAPFQGRSRPLDWTGVLTFLSIKEK